MAPAPGDLLAGAAGELLPHALNDFPTARYHLEGLGDVLAQLAQPGAAAALAGGGRGLDHALARQMLGKGLARRSPTGERHDLGGARRGLFGGDLVLGRRTRQFVEPQGELIEQSHHTLGALTVELALQLGDLQLLVRDQRLVVGGARPGIGQLRLDLERPRGGRLQRSLERGNIIRRGGDGVGHGEDGITPRRPWHRKNAPCRPRYPATSGRQVRCGFLQSMPSSM
jgi:hypothetical protein